MQTHRATKLYSDFMGKEVEIDIGISKLIKLLWDNGIRTANCCENNVPKNWMWVEFWSHTDYLRFLNIVFSCKKISEFGRRIASGIVTTNRKFFKSDIPNSWQVDALTYNIGTLEKPNHIMSVSLRFPRSDYTKICKKLISIGE